MTYEEKKQYLRSFLHAKRDALDAARRLDEYRAANAGLRSVIVSDMPKGGGNHRDLSDYVAKLDEMENDLITRVARYHARAQAVESVIDAVEDDTYARLLRLRYLDGDTFEQIAVTMGYSWRQVMRLHYLAVMSVNMS